jgi:CheY-like chemotaxis protein
MTPNSNVQNQAASCTSIPATEAGLMSGEKKTIVLVDDEVILTRALKLMLERSGGFSVFTENNPRHAMELILAHKPDVIVLDIIMPGLTGTELADQLRQNIETKDIPVIFYSGCHTGPAGYPFISKPASKDEILSCIHEVLKSSGK